VCNTLKKWVGVRLRVRAGNVSFPCHQKGGMSVAPGANFTRKRPSVKKYDCSSVHKVKQVHGVCCFPGVKKQTHPVCEK
jgi:hypothetical protein